jgi:hypothetical protein
MAEQALAEPTRSARQSPSMGEGGVGVRVRRGMTRLGDSARFP